MSNSTITTARPARRDDLIRPVVIGGDGIGPEVTAAALSVLEAAGDLHGFRVEPFRLPLDADNFLATGRTLSQEDVDLIENEGDGILFGAIGDSRIPDGRHAREILLGLRGRLNLYANVRPARLCVDRLSPLRSKGPAEINMYMVRENTEDAYVGIGGQFARLGDVDTGVDVIMTTRSGIERVCRAAAHIARSTTGKRICMVHKTNAIQGGHAMWMDVWRELAAEWSDLNCSTMHVDVAAMELVRAPEQFDVIVTANLFGDILSDLGAQLQGGLGIAPSLSYRDNGPCLAEPVHGSAPTLVGTGKANPIGAIRSAAMLVEGLGLADAATSIERAAVATIVDGPSTPDVGGDATLEQVVKSVISNLEVNR